MNLDDTTGWAGSFSLKYCCPSDSKVGESYASTIAIVTPLPLLPPATDLFSPYAPRSWTGL